MSTTNVSVSPEIIEHFLNGTNSKKYVVSIEANYHEPSVFLVVSEPNTDKKIEKHSYKPFLWYKADIIPLLYGGKKIKAIEAAQKYGVTTKKLCVGNSEGFVPSRLENGYKYLVTCTKSYNDLILFFKEGGIDVFDKEYSKNFFMFTPVEQFMIQTGIRLFKGMDDYDDLHRFQFDLETEGLSGKNDAIFQIGMRDNRGFEYVLESTGDTLADKRKSERDNIKLFFEVIDTLKPDLITGYNSEGFDWSFFLDRCERLGIDINKIAKGLDGKFKFKRKPSMLKLGNEQEAYLQTHIFGYNIIDIAHSVRRAQAINSDIKSWSLKYITKYSDIAKNNRVYVSGDKIHTIWSDTINEYAFNDQNGDFYKISERMPLKDGYTIVKGNYIVQRYLLDDLWETEQIDKIFNQAAFLISKLLPTTYGRSTTMGTASQWKLIMAAWSYENNLAIPATEPKRNFTGGLSRLLEVGYAKNVVKFDYAALYPKNQITHDIFPNLDISGVMKGLLTYIVDTRDKFKFLTDTHKKNAKKISEEIKKNKDIYTKEKIEELNIEEKKHKDLSNLYNKKQLPLKILANSWFGAYGAPYIFNWGDTDCAEETTCRGRQYLRLMVRHFTEKYGFKALVGDSVTYDTPVYIRNKSRKNYIDVLPICDLFNENSGFLDTDKFRDFEEKPFEVLTRNGWKEIKYVYRHETDKKIHRITTKDRLLNVTEDHSLFQNGLEIKPSTLKRGDVIDTYTIPSNITDNILLTEDEAFLYGFFLGDGSSLCSKRKVKYKTKKTGAVKIYFSKRSDWKISNSKLEHLNKLKEILKNSFNIDGLIKNHLLSSGVYNLVVHNTKFNKLFCEEFYTSYREKKIPKVILNANLSIKKSFIEGVFASDGYGDSIDTCSDIGMKSQVAMAGISLLLKELNVEYKIKTRADKQNFISFSLKNSNRNNSSFTDKTKKRTNEVWKNEIIFNKDKNNYVYDISTEDGTFICGINGIIAHNTDGFNFAIPDNISTFKYLAKGSHWKTTEYANQELIGLDAVLAEFNETYMIGRMGLDIDDICNSTINFSRKNYANDIGGKIKFVGNSIKSKKMPVYIEEFLSKAIRLLLDGKGKEFINHYHDYVDKIYNYNIPLVKIASKSKIKSTISDYKKKANKKNKAGNPMPKQAHMELAMKDNLTVNLGDVLYYVNTGNSKGQGDIKTIRGSKMTKKEKADYELKHGRPVSADYIEIQINCKLINPNDVDLNFEILKEIETFNKILTTIDDIDKIKEINLQIIHLEKQLLTDEYNVNKYLEAFNKKVKPLLVCFHPDIRNKILLTIKKDKKTKLEKLTEKNIFSDVQCQLVSGMPDEPIDQDTYEELMTMEDKEIKFWDKVNRVPNNIEEKEWEKIRADYHIRKAIERESGIINEKNMLDDIFKHFEIEQLRMIEQTLTLPDSILILTTVDDNGYLVSRKWDVILYHVNDIFNYETEAIERNTWYQSNNIEKVDKYELWLDYKSEQEIMNISVQVQQEMLKIQDISLPRVQELAYNFENTYVSVEDDQDDDDDDDDDEYNPEKLESEVDEFIPEMQRADFEIEIGKISEINSDLLSSIVEIIEEPIIPLNIIKRNVNPFDEELFNVIPNKSSEMVDYAKELLMTMNEIKEEDNEWNF